MKKLILLLAIAGLFNLKVDAQYARCASTDYVQEEMQRNPQYARDREALERYTQQNINSPATRSSNSLPYIIPIVFHVLHNYGPENLPDSVLINAVRIMNEDYRKLNADTAQIVPSFINIAADCQIEFRLATIDPNGGCTNGIEHIQTLLTYNADNASKLHPWPSNKYLNVWIAASLARQGAAAWAYLPPAPSPSVDGIMCWYTYADNFSRTLTHEAGHCFNLSHTWGDLELSPEVTCGDDGVSDTPITKGWNPGHCDLTGSICNPPIIENVQNYMDYSYCNNMFTQGQKARMQTLLTSSIGGRNNLWSPANLIATGTDTPTGSVCTPVADFMADYSYACAGDSVHFTDLSWKANVTGWNWSFPGGSPSTSTLQNPSIAYSAAGLYNVTLKASSSAGTDSTTKTSVVRITANALNTIPYVESFEDTSSFPGNDGFVVNPDGNSTWTRVTNTAATGSACIKMNNYTNTAGSVDEWITPSFNFSNMNTPITMSFKLANAQRNSGSNDELKIYYSLNCGRSWSSTSYSKAGASLATAGIVTSNFTPNNPSQWRQETIPINSVHNRSNVRFKFQSTSDHGNNVYIDDINITGIDNAVNDMDELQSGFSMYPNPSQGITKIEFSLSKSSNVRLEIKDIIGQTVAIVMNGTISSGLHENSLPALTPGIYLVDLTVNNKHNVHKLVVSN